MLVNGFLIFIAALIIAMYFVRKIIHVSHQKNLFDEPGDLRKIHIDRTPNLGGIGIFASMMLACCMLLFIVNIPFINYIIFCSFLLFMTGLADDLAGIGPVKKIAVQLVIAFIIALCTNFRITSFYGLFGIFELPFFGSVLITVFFIISLINAINLIDGINCLAAGIVLLACSVFAFYFYEISEPGFMLLAEALCGCVAGFLFYNRTPAKIFMGDTGSLFLGFFIAIFSIHFLESFNSFQGVTASPVVSPGPAILLGLLIVPVYDTLRVFVLRIARGGSPFVADRNHIHHLLLDLNFSHLQATYILLSINIISLLLVFLLRNLHPEIIILSSISLMAIVNIILSVRRARHKTHIATAEHIKRPVLTFVRGREKIV